MTNEQKAKFEDKFYKAKHEEERSLESYRQILQEMEAYKPEHVERMTRVFDKTQEFERKRILFYKTVFLDCHGLLQTYNDERFEKIFQDYLFKVNKADPISDLNWWSRQFGCNMEPCWPTFEEYAKK